MASHVRSGKPGRTLTLLTLRGLPGTLRAGQRIEIDVDGEHRVVAEHGLSARQIEILEAGGELAWMQQRIRSRS